MKSGYSGSLSTGIPARFAHMVLNPNKPAAAASQPFDETNNISATSRKLGISRTTIYKHLQ